MRLVRGRIAARIGPKLIVFRARSGDEQTHEHAHAHARVGTSTHSPRLSKIMEAEKDREPVGRRLNHRAPGRLARERVRSIGAANLVPVSSGSDVFGGDGGGATAACAQISRKRVPFRFGQVQKSAKSEHSLAPIKNEPNPPLGAPLGAPPPPSQQPRPQIISHT